MTNEMDSGQTPCGCVSNNASSRQQLPFLASVQGYSHMLQVMETAQLVLCLISSIVITVPKVPKGFFSRADATPNLIFMIQLLQLQQHTKPNLLSLDSGPNIKTSRDECYIFSSFIEKCLF